MPRAKKLKETDTSFDTQALEQTPQPEPQELPPTEQGFAAKVEQKKYTPKEEADPRSFENIKGTENRVQLLKSDGEGAWVIRFDHDPSLDKGPNGETYSKENQHPVLKMLKSQGFRWDFDGGDRKGGWGKRFTGDAYGADHIEARKVLKLAAEMIGAPMEEKGRGVG